MSVISIVYISFHHSSYFWWLKFVKYEHILQCPLFAISNFGSECQLM